MLGDICGRPSKPWWSLSPHSFSLHHNPHSLPRFSDSSTPAIASVDGGGASIWREVVPAAAGGGDWRRDYLRPAVHGQKGEGSWNVAWDARPARWLYRLDVAYLLVGVCLVLSHDVVVSEVKGDQNEQEEGQGVDDGGDKEGTSSSDYRVTGVLADGRCLFRAIAHGACLQNGGEAPDEVRQRELADELRAQVVDELLKRRDEVERFIEEDFDAYVKRIEQPYVWGGEPELSMASHVLKRLISVFMKDKNTGNLTKIAIYGEEYNDNQSPINVLFHGYGHYDLLERSSN